MTTGALRVLLAGVVDYAGLFPPAVLDVPTAAANYAEYRAGPDAWMLGRFVAPVGRLGEVASARAALAGDDRWPVSAIAGADLAADVATIETFNRSESRFVVESVEVRIAGPDEIARQAPAAVGLELFVEVPVADDPLPALRAVRDAGARAKIRTGGVTADAFPTAAQVARFIGCCAELGLPFKATAGLHHPIRAAYRLTYAPDAPVGTMFGFLNVFLAAAYVRAGLGEREAAALLETTDAAEIRFDDDGVEWRGHRLDDGQLRATRDRCALAFGSCSFREPVDELHALSLLT